MANPSRGELDLTLNGTVYRMAATLNQACELEDVLNTSIFGIVESLTHTGGMTLKTIATVLHQGILGGYDHEKKDLATAPSYLEVREAVFHDGALNLSETVTRLLQLWLLSAEQSKEAEETAKKD